MKFFLFISIIFGLFSCIRFKTPEEDKIDNTTPPLIYTTRQITIHDSTKANDTILFISAYDLDDSIKHIFFIPSDSTLKKLFKITSFPYSLILTDTLTSPILEKQSVDLEFYAVDYTNDTSQSSKTTIKFSR